MSDTPLLSICIPTYNRADVLKQCLDSIVNSPCFGDDVEVVVSDNCSTDSTPTLVKQYASKYSSVKYFRNDENIGGDRNILKSLQLGTGCFLKLNNDYSVFTSDGLAKLCAVVRDNIVNKPAVYFDQLAKSEKVWTTTTIDDILAHYKWGMSWIGCYGYWREDFASWDCPDRRIDTMFQQVDWFVRTFKSKRNIVVLEYPITTRQVFSAKQGGYDFIRVHSHNYFIQFEELLQEGLVTDSTLSLAKKEVCANMLSWITLIRRESDTYSYEMSKPMATLRAEFSRYNWFYPLVAKFFARYYWQSFKCFIKRLI